VSQRIEFGSKQAADAARNQFEEYICPVDDDRRLKTVAFVSDAPDGVLDQAEAQALDSRESEQLSTDMAGPLGQETRDRISEMGGFDGPATTFSWRRAKAIFAREGLTDKFSDALGFIADYEDPQEGAEAWIRQARESDATQGTMSASGGARDVGEEDTRQQMKAAEAGRTAQAEGCDHARGHCENGEPEACEFLQQTCGYSEEEVEEILGLADDRHQGETEQTDLVTVGGGRFPEMQVTPEEAGALRRAWRSYKAGVGSIEGLLSDLRTEVVRTRQAWATINRLRGEHDQPDLHPDRLHGLLENLAEMPASIPEVRILDHFAGSGKEQVLATDDQRTLEGERANDQARLAGGEQGEQGQGEVEQPTEVNEGGLMADQRESTGSDQTEQQRPDFMQVAEGGQKTL